MLKKEQRHFGLPFLCCSKQRPHIHIDAANIDGCLPLEQCSSGFKVPLSSSHPE
jgi:hypothetical protein